jgi:gliding motility-associated-like protein
MFKYILFLFFSFTTFSIFSQVGSCATPNAPFFNVTAGSWSQDNGSDWSSCMTTLPEVGGKIKMYHTVTSSAGGTLGFIQNIAVTDASCQASNLWSTRQVNLYNVGSCGGTPIAYDQLVTNSSYSSTFNPEWTSLSPSTNYIIETILTVPSSCSGVINAVCLDVYYPASSSCTASVGTYTISSTGTTVTAGTEYTLSNNGETITITSNGNYVLSPDDFSAGDATIGFLIFDQQPPSPIDPNNLSPGVGGFLGATNGPLNDGNSGGTSSSVSGKTTLWFVPTTFDAGGNGGAKYVDNNSDGCYNIGTPIKVNYGSTPPSCSSCATATCKVVASTAATLSAARTQSSADILAQESTKKNTISLSDNGVAKTICVPVTIPSDATTFGFKHALPNANGGCSLSDPDIVRSYTLTPASCVGANILPSTTNGGGVGSGFNPEWNVVTGAPSAGQINPGNYIFCFTIKINPGSFCTSVPDLTLGYYSNGTPPPSCPTEKTYISLDWAQGNPFIPWNTKSYTCSSPKDTVYKNVDINTVTTGGEIQTLPGFKMEMTTNSNASTKSSVLVSVNGVPYSYYGPTGTAPANVLDWGPMAQNQDIMEPYIPKGATVTLDICDTRAAAQSFPYTIHDYATGSTLKTGTATPSSASCTTITFTISSPTMTWKIDGGTTGVVDNTNGSCTIDPSQLSAGTHTLQYTFDNGQGCTITGNAETFTVTGGPTITPTIASVCQGTTSTTMTYTATGTPTKYSIDWNTAANNAGFLDVVDATLTSSPQTITLPAAAPGATYTGSLTVKNAAGCSSVPQNVSVVINSSPTANVPSTITVCKGANVPVTALTSTPTGATFSWTNSNTNIGLAASGTGDVSSFTATNSGATKITSSVVVTPTLNGCTGATNNFTIEVNPSLTPTFAGCSPTLNSVTIDWSPGLAGATTYTLNYTVNGNAQTPITINAPTTSSVISGLSQNDVVNATLSTTGTGCYIDGSTSCVAISCNQPTISTQPTDLTICDGDAVSFTANSTDANDIQWQGYNPLTLVWEDIPGMTTNILSYPTSALVLDGTQYRLKANESSNTCPNYSNVVNLTVNPIPAVNSIADIETCPNLLVSNTILSSTPPGSTYDWTNDNVNTGVSASAAGATDFTSFTSAVNNGASDLVSTITVTPTLNGCTGNPETFTVTVKPTVTPVVSVSSADMSNVNFTWTTNANSNEFALDTAIAYSATLPAGGYKPAGSVPGTTTNYSFTGLQMGQTAFLQVTPKQSAGSTGEFCPASASASGITLNCTPPAKPTMPSFTPVCEGASFTISVTNDAAATYQWKISTDGVNFSNVNPADFGASATLNDLTTSISKAYMNNAIVKVVLTDVATGQCSIDSDPLTLVVNPNPTATVSVTNKTTCLDDPVGATVTFTSSGGTAPYTYDYSIDGNVTTASSTSSFNHTTDTEISGMIYDLSKVTDANGCFSTVSNQSVTVIVHPLPDVDFTANELAGCLPFEVAFTDNSSGVLSNTVIWDFGNGETSTQTDVVSSTYNSSGDFDVTLTAVDVNGCIGVNQKTAYIHVTEPPVARFSVTPDKLTILNTEVKLKNLSLNNPISYKWIFGDGTPVSYEENPIHEYQPNAADYIITLVAIVNDNCRDTMSYAVSVDDEVIYYIPNTFTPNGDENNNTFQPIFYSGFDAQHFDFKIYDRWGQLVFESHNPKIGWDGSFGDKMLNPDTYVWKLGFKELKTEKQHYKTGHVNLLR